MSPPWATRPGLLVGAAALALGVLAVLYCRSPAPAEEPTEEPAEGPAGPLGVECGFFPEELCSALFHGKEAAARVARFCRGAPGPGVRAHLRAGNCSGLVRALRFITRPLSAEEANFSLAYIIAARRELPVFVPLLRAIYAPQNAYCVHVDARAPRALRAAARTLAGCLPNVFVWPAGARAATASASASGAARLHADLGCMHTLLRPALDWSHVIGLGGQAFPLKTNREIVRRVRSRWLHQNVTPRGGGTRPPAGGNLSLAGRLEAGLPAPPGGRTPPPPRGAPHNLTVYAGSAHYVLTRKFVAFVLSDARARDLLRWATRRLHSPERHYWLTLNRLADAPGAAPDVGWEDDVRAVKRRDEEGKAHNGCKGHYVQDSCVYGPGDLPWLIRSPSLFADRFEASTDPLVVTCLERRHRLRELQATEVPVEPHWRFEQEGRFDLRLS